MNGERWCDGQRPMRRSLCQGPSDASVVPRPVTAPPWSAQGVFSQEETDMEVQPLDEEGSS